MCAREVLSPPEDYVAADAPKNNDSLVLKVTYGKHCFLLTGDMEKQMEGCEDLATVGRTVLLSAREDNPQIPGFRRRPKHRVAWQTAKPDRLPHFLRRSRAVPP
jgi:hypothetical protein